MKQWNQMFWFRFVVPVVFFALMVGCGKSGGSDADDNHNGSNVSVPAIPLGVFADEGDGSATIKWNPVQDATSYRIYSASTSGVSADNYSILADGARDTSVSASFTKSGLTNGKTYYFVVTAVNTAGESAESDQTSATPQAITGIFSGTVLMNGTHSGHSATLLPDGTVLIAGGISPIDNFGVLVSSPNSGEVYNPSTRIFSRTNNRMITVSRGLHTATLLSSGKVLIAGGLGDTILSTAELYDPATGLFRSVGNLNVARFLHTATLLPNGKVLITGGAADRRDSVELFDPDTETFNEVGHMAMNRVGHTATLLPNNTVLIAGGADDNSAELYDPATGTFSLVGNTVIHRKYHTSTVLASGKVLLIGGQAPMNYDTLADTTETAEIYDWETRQFTQTGSLAFSRYLHTATLLPNGKVLVTGGVKSLYYSVMVGGEPHICIIGQCGWGKPELYDPATGTFSLTGWVYDFWGVLSGPGNMYKLRASHTATLLSNGTVLVAGGNSINESENWGSGEIFVP